MADSTELKHRIRSIQDTHQITKAMELISISKLRKVMQKQSFSSIYFDNVRYTVKDILLHSSDVVNPYTKKRKGNRTAYIVIAGDKGLCGSYNSDVLKLAWQDMQKRPEHYVITVGQMARSFFENRERSIDLAFTHAVTNPTLHDARGIARDILNLYDKNLMDEVFLVFTHMYSASVRKPEIIRLLPVLPEDIQIDVQTTFAGDILYDQAPNEILKVIVPQYLIGLIYSALIHASASEHTARRTAMMNANQNADKILDELNLQYNKLRQDKITTELADLSAGRI